ncbi:MAG: DUF4249 family protein [Bacteroidetes bacterium]|nr:DUF4249 family protein [Bacteroidota bacterium]
MHKTKFNFYKINNSLLFLFLISLLINSCKNEIDVAAPWKETIIVYGLLDPASPENYIRIQKAYLDPQGNAYKFTGVNDSIYSYKLDVKLYVKRNGNIIDTIFPEYINGDLEGIKKDTGLFSNSPNYLYKINQPIKASALSPNPEDYTYNIEVKDPKTGYICTSSTITTGYLEPLSPVTNNITPITINSKPGTYLTIGYREGRNVKSYDMKIRFWYREYNKNSPSDSQTQFVDWILFKNRLTSSLRGYELKTNSIEGFIFYELLQYTIAPNQDINRKALYCDVEYYGVGEDLYTYIQVNIPSIGIIQKKPEYTNITNGLGLFSSRYITAFRKIPISAEMKSQLQNSNYTKTLNFKP